MPEKTKNSQPHLGREPKRHFFSGAFGAIGSVDDVATDSAGNDASGYTRLAYWMLKSPRMLPGRESAGLVVYNIKSRYRNGVAYTHHGSAHFNDTGSFPHLLTS